ncbi:MAG: N-acetyl-D-Glu racemase DgcA [Sphingobium sp.]
MISLVSVAVERWPVAGAFNISRGSKRHVDVVVCSVSDGRHTGHGEATAIYYHGETAERCADAIRLYCEAEHPGGLSRTAIQRDMPKGAARNALDCALWDLEAKRAGVPVWQLAGVEPPRPLSTAFTISMNSPADMERDAQAAVRRGFSLLKCKLGGAGDLDRVAAVRQGAPDARLIVDANESWPFEAVLNLAGRLAEMGVEMVEQPLPRGQESALIGLNAPVPFCADESCQDSLDIAILTGFDVINIKLDKAGGLTEGLALRDEAIKAGQKLMIGCMLCTSLAIAPAFLLAQQADWVDLDGALLLERDRDDPLRLEGGMLHPSSLWGMP